MRKFWLFGLLIIFAIVLSAFLVEQPNSGILCPTDTPISTRIPKDTDVPPTSTNTPTETDVPTDVPTSTNTPMDVVPTDTPTLPSTPTMVSSPTETLPSLPTPTETRTPEVDPQPSMTPTSDIDPTPSPTAPVETMPWVVTSVPTFTYTPVSTIAETPISTETPYPPKPGSADEVYQDYPGDHIGEIFISGDLYMLYVGVNAQDGSLQLPTTIHGAAFYKNTIWLHRLWKSGRITINTGDTIVVSDIARGVLRYEVVASTYMGYGTYPKTVKNGDAYQYIATCYSDSNGEWIGVELFSIRLVR